MSLTLSRASANGTLPDRIAILVRARTHLPEIVRALQAAQIPFRAVDIEPLGKSQVVRDLHALTLAILRPADRVAWLALLRSPVCGLALPDLHELCRDDDRATIPQLFRSRASRLSENARRRCERLFAVLDEAIALRGRSRFTRDRRAHVDRPRRTRHLRKYRSRPSQRRGLPRSAPAIGSRR